MRCSSLLVQATLLLLTVSLVSAQTMAMLQGRVLDPLRRGRSWRVGRGAHSRSEAPPQTVEGSTSLGCKLDYAPLTRGRS